MQNRNSEALLGQVWARCKLAVPVWLVLARQASRSGKHRFAVKRSALARAIGIKRLPSISQALTALHKLGVIERKVKRCRRDDGTLFFRLKVHLKHLPIQNAHRIRPTGDQPGTLDRVSTGYQPGTFHRVSTGLQPGTAPGIKKRNHSPGTPGIKKRYTSSKEDVGTGGVSTPPRTLAAAADAAGAGRCAEAQRPRPAAAASMELPSTWQPMRKTMRKALQRVCSEVCCKPSAFKQESANFLILVDGRQQTAPYVVISNLDHTRQAEIEFVEPKSGEEDPTYQPWIGNSEQIFAIRQMLTKRDGLAFGQQEGG